jgi:hypothetical protein
MQSVHHVTEFRGCFIWQGYMLIENPHTDFIVAKGQMGSISPKDCGYGTAPITASNNAYFFIFSFSRCHCGYVD